MAAKIRLFSVSAKKIIEKDRKRHRKRHRNATENVTEKHKTKETARSF
jgi:hypothetical protein